MIKKLIDKITCKDEKEQMEKNKEQIKKMSEDLLLLNNKLNMYLKDYKELSETLSEKEKELLEKETTIINLNGEINALKSRAKYELPFIDTELGKMYPVIPMIAYKNKRGFGGKYYTTFLNEMITPNAFEVLKLFRAIREQQDVYSWCLNAGTIISKKIKYMPDYQQTTKEDYYLLPSEIIASGRGDCEDFAFLVASGNPDNVAVAYGFYEIDGKKFGHAFNIFFYAGTMFILELTGGTTAIIPYTDTSGYSINYIITKNRCYVVDDSVAFGEIDMTLDKYYSSLKWK